MWAKKRVNTILRILSLNVGTMTGKSREFAEMLDRGRKIYLVYKRLRGKGQQQERSAMDINYSIVGKNKQKRSWHHRQPEGEG